MALNSRWRRAAGVAAGALALSFTVACTTARSVPDVSARALAANPAGTPVLVTCEPHQRTLVRQAVVNGAAVSQVECVAAETGAAAPVPVAYAPAAAPAVYAPVPARRVSQPVYTDLPDTEVVPVRSAPARPIRTSQVVYDERPVQKKRSVQKSAIIIGSSAGAGAGVGAAIGGKKGALIGAAVGGGGAAVWDQVTRRK